MNTLRKWDTSTNGSTNKRASTHAATYDHVVQFFDIILTILTSFKAFLGYLNLSRAFWDISV